jgi:CRISPR system Cascade subunit CasD
MSEAPQYLALYLDAPLQSWGYQSRFDRRTTLGYPTRSGILGLLAAAMGIDRADTTGLARLDALRLTVYTFPHAGLLTDFHTVGGGYDDKTQRQHITRTADGKVGSTVVTKREYLQHARFGAVLTGPAPLLTELAAALRNPVWGTWLGRKSCLPASPVLQGLFGDAETALARLVACETAARARCRGRAARVSPLPLREIREVERFEDGTDTLMDRPTDFAQRRFQPRRVEVRDHQPLTR